MSMKNRLPCDRRGGRSEFWACFHPLRVLRSKRLRCLWNCHVRNSRFRRLFYDNWSMETRDMTISDPKISKKCERPMREDSFLYNQSIRSPDPSYLIESDINLKRHFWGISREGCIVHFFKIGLHADASIFWYFFQSFLRVLKLTPWL